MGTRRIAIGAAVTGPILAVWAWSALTLTNRSSVAQGGKVELTPHEVMFQRTSEGDPLPAQLTLVNAGGFPVRITGGESTCGCTILDLPSDRRLAPGERLVLTVRGSPPAFGDKQATLTLHTDSPGQPILRIPVILKGQVLAVPRVTQIPEQLELRVTQGRPLAHEFAVHTLEAPESAPWIGSATADVAGSQVARLDLKEEPAPAGSVVRSYRFHIEAPTPPPDGTPMATTIRFTTTRPSQFELRAVRVQYRSVPAVRAVPNELFFRPRQSGGDAAERTVLFQTESGAGPLMIRAEPPENGWLSTSEVVRPTDSGPLVGRATVRVLPDHLPPDENVETTLVFRTDHPACPTLPVRVHVVR